MSVPIAAFLIVASLIYGLGILLIRAKRNRESEVFSGGRRRPLIFGLATSAMAGVIPSSAALKANITKELRQAGFYHRFAFEEYAALRNTLTVGWVLLIGTLIVVAPSSSRQSELRLLMVGIVGALVFYSVPRLVLRAWSSARRRRIEHGLPDALDMITMCMTGGLPMQYALGRVGKELNDTHSDLACELRIVGRQMDVGSLTRALEQFAERIDTPDVRSLAAMVNQTDRQGASVAGAFQDFADEVRRTRRQRADEHASKTTVKMLLPIVFCLAPPVYIMLLSPAVIELRAFVLRENRPGGVLSPTTVSTGENVTPDFSYLRFIGGTEEEAPP